MTNSPGPAVRHLTEEISRIDWDDPRKSARQCRGLLGRLAADRGLLTELVRGTERDPRRFGRSESHPLMSKLCLYEDPERRCQLRLHAFTGRERDLVPHDHKYPFSAYVLAGGYVHVWNRRTDATCSGEFTSRDLAAGVVALERPGSCYTFQHSLVHQTIVMPDTVSLFLRGPKRQSRWHAAGDMLHLLDGYEAPRPGGRSHQGSVPLSPDQFHAVRADLEQRGIIAKERPPHAVA
ncbi:hypothetical protein A6A06_01800 [Streptomyces sp. CB02923]|uniref:hypothetical protein n=1 Tax=Streptomyces sp. CB02923 TaxID=1718985 RepID=UPI00093E07CB|nr:hypothetical protein [Streptomyces sp. CB02923]OKI09460.1 hypothetical protein A6A06_01800 [Streptomyces sp. CB02923]